MYLNNWIQHELLTSAAEFNHLFQDFILRVSDFFFLFKNLTSKWSTPLRNETNWWRLKKLLLGSHSPSLKKGQTFVIGLPESESNWTREACGHGTVHFLHIIIAGCHSGFRFPWQHAPGAPFHSRVLSDPPTGGHISSVALLSAPRSADDYCQRHGSAESRSGSRPPPVNHMWWGCWLVDKKCILRTNSSWILQLLSVVAQRASVFSHAGRNGLTFQHRFSTFN